MKITDLGVLDGPLLLFGGPYSNLQALQALLDIGADAICTGDVVAYGADGEACVSLMREAGIPTVKGNCEAQLAEGADDCGCGFDEGTTCSLLSRGWYAHAVRHVSAESRDWMAACPDRIVFTHQGRRFAVIHGGASAVNRFLWSVSPQEELAAEIALLIREVGPVDVVISGHSGIAFRRRIGATDWLNAGVIGMPPNDGNTRTECMLLEDGRVSLRRLAYDHHAAARAMIKAGLTQGYEKSLISGFWPSEDVLPRALRRPQLDDVPEPAP